MILSWLFNRATSPLFRDWDDPAWKPTGVDQKFTGYDYDRASAARLASLDRAKAARKLADRYGRGRR